MNATLEPATLDELVDAVRSTPRLIAVGAGTKPRLGAVAAVKLSTVRLSGLVEYEPDEFTFTARAGTPVREVAAVLEAKGQHLPFDPMLVEAGATLGGTVASGLSGPGRFRFGGVRDFILGVRFVDGEGRLLRMGAKVIKNAAGFDVPKFMVGSLGRFGVLAEMTFKVFPRPESSLTLCREMENLPDAIRMLVEAAGSRWELRAIDCLPGTTTVALRLGGPPSALEPMAREILGRWPGRVLSATEAESLWNGLAGFCWAHPDGCLLKVPLTPRAVAPLHAAMDELGEVRMHVSSGGQVAYVSVPRATPAAALDGALRSVGLAGLTLRGDGPLWWGMRSRPEILRSVKAAFDAGNRFPSLDD